MTKIEEAFLTKKLIATGIRPKYKAFGYVLCALENHEFDEMIAMSDRDIIRTLAYESHTDPRTVKTNMRTLISSCMSKPELCSDIIRNLPVMEGDEKPTVKEFLVAVSCSMYEEHQL